ncbi:MAG: nitroreductase family protein [Ignavibacteriaceae bacterium]|nr:nitroreductase family protein [Ignavibacteriaceae bacterium]
MIDELIEEKIASTEFPVIDLIKNRWSPRAFSSDPVEEEKIMSLLEAARWAPSCFNEQPWNFIIFKKENRVEFNKIIDVLSPRNKQWAKDAPLILLSVAQANFERNGKANRHALHDVGAAVTNLTLQATSMGLYVHQMAGFDSEKAKQLFNIPKGYEPVSAIAIGYYGSPFDLPEEFKKAESAHRSRKPISDFAFKGKWE